MRIAVCQFPIPMIIVKDVLTRTRFIKGERKLGLEILWIESKRWRCGAEEREDEERQLDPMDMLLVLLKNY